jgi:hypothetical protein
MPRRLRPRQDTCQGGREALRWVDRRSVAGCVNNRTFVGPRNLYVVVSCRTLPADDDGHESPCELRELSEYNDDYPTCSCTYVTLRIYPGVLSPDEITLRLNLEPSSTQRPEVRGPGVKDLPSAWFLRSEGVVDSRDVRRHLDWLLKQIADKRSAFTALRTAGVRIDVSCYWMSASGHGGPTLSPTQMSALAALDLDVGFDVYFARGGTRCKN